MLDCGVKVTRRLQNTDTAAFCISLSDRLVQKGLVE